MSTAGGMGPVQNRLVCGDRAAMVARVRRISMTALPIFKPSRPGSIYVR